MANSNASVRQLRALPFLGLLVGIAILAFRRTADPFRAEEPTNQQSMIHRLRPNEFTVSFEPRGDVLLASNPLALEGLKIEKKKHSRHQAAQKEVDAAQKQRAFDITSAMYQDAREEFAQTPVTDYTKGKLPSVDESLPYCTREQVLDGRWNSVHMDAPPYIIGTKHLRCFEHDVYYTSPWKSWEWESNDAACRIVPHLFNDTAFCDSIKGGTVSIVGDSLSWEHYRSLLQLHHIQPHQLFQHQSKELHQNIIHQICDGQAAALYRRDDRLQNVTATLKDDMPTVLILNRGAHYVPDDVLLPELQTLVVPAIQEWFQQCATKGLDCRLYWRTSVPGHPHCANATTPVNDMERLENIISDRSLYTERTWGYHWYDYQPQNEKVIAMWESLNLPHFEVIDAYYLNLRRPDGHRSHQNDCLHNCYPGKMDVYNRLLWHALERNPITHDVSKAPATPENTIYDKNATEAAKEARLAAESAK